MLEKTTVRLKQDNVELTNAVDNLEQYTRRNSLRIFGIKEEKGEKTEDVERAVLQVLNDSLEAYITVDNIDRCYRIGAFKVGSSKPRAIIIKFTSYRYRARVFEAKKKLKGSGIVIREDLTKSRIDILNNAIEQYGYKNVWSRDGVIIVLKDNKKMFIKTMQDLERIIKLN